jgi:hypothetical protein
MDTEPDLERHLTEAVSRLRDTQPADDLWPAIARQLTPRHPRGTLLMRWPTALAAGLVIAVATSASTAILLHRARGADSVATTVASREAAAALVTASFAPGDAALAHAIDDLEQAVRASVDHLDPDARASVNRSLTSLDSAIAQAAARQSAAPGDPSAARYLTSTLRKKLQLLRTVSQLTQQQS